MIAVAAAFISTNLDDILLLSLLFAAAKDNKDVLSIYSGQLLGISLLFLLSTLARGILTQLPFNIIPFLGLLPIALGLLSLRRREEKEFSLRLGIIPVCLLTLSNGADNLALYIPLFMRYGKCELLLSYLIFILLTLLWCFLSSQLAGFESVKAFIRKYDRWIFPAVLILLGLWIILSP